jgi:hypothetical protein
VILVVRNAFIFQTVTDTKMKQFENSMETRDVHLEKFEICSISYTAKVNSTIECFSRTPQLTQRRLLWPVKFSVAALEGTVTSEVAVPVVSHIPIGRSYME